MGKKKASTPRMFLEESTGERGSRHVAQCADVYNSPIYMLRRRSGLQLRFVNSGFFVAPEYYTFKTVERLIRPICSEQINYSTDAPICSSIAAAHAIFHLLLAEEGGDQCAQ